MVIYKVKYYSAIKKELLIPTTTWTDLKVTLMSEKSHFPNIILYDFINITFQNDKIIYRERTDCQMLEEKV